MRGTRPTTGLSRRQQTFVTVLWIGSFLAMLIVPRFVSGHSVLPVIIAPALFGANVLINIGLYAFARRPQEQIVSGEGLRGPFVSRDFGWPILFGLGMIFVGIGARTLSETGGLDRQPQAWAIFLLIALAVTCGPFAMIGLQTYAFWIDDTDQLWVRRWGRYAPLQIALFTQVRSHATRLRYGGMVTTRLVFSGGNNPLGRISLPIGHVISRSHGTLVDGALVDALVVDQCRKTGFTVQSLDSFGKLGWVATLPTSP